MDIAAIVFKYRGWTGLTPIAHGCKQYTARGHEEGRRLGSNTDKQIQVCIVDRPNDGEPYPIRDFWLRSSDQ